MLVLRYRFLSDPGLHRELTVLRRLARRAQARGIGGPPGPPCAVLCRSTIRTSTPVWRGPSS
jgi:hypothetical protein